MNEFLPQLPHLKSYWSRSRAFRWALIASLVYLVLRFAVQIIYALDGGSTPPDDLAIYLQAAQAMQSNQALYELGQLARVEFFQYAPSFALLILPLLRIPVQGLVIGLTVLHTAGYFLLYRQWGRIFARLNLPRASELLAWTFPVWIVFSAFWGELVYQNIYVFMALLATCLIEAVLFEELGWSIFWGTIIIQIKPQWAFALALPIMIKRNRFFFKLLAGLIAGYLLVVVVAAVISNPGYILEQYRQYYVFLATLSGRFPWRDASAPFLGYNHSIQQVIRYIGIPTNSAMWLSLGIKVVLLSPLAWVLIRIHRHGGAEPAKDRPQVSLLIIFAFYLAAFICLDMVWELFLGIVLFSYLLSIQMSRWQKWIIWAVFLPYALVDLWQMVSYAALGDTVLYNGAYVLTDPTIYIPWILLILLVFYGIVLQKLFSTIQIKNIQPSLRAAVPEGKR